MTQKKYITASDLFNYGKCAHRPFMDIHADSSQKGEIHPLVKLLWESGVQYEDRVLEFLKSQHPDRSIVLIDPQSPTSEELFEKTQKTMKDGADFIYQGVLISGDKLGRPDLLEKVSGKSVFGDYFYVPTDIKMARVEETWDSGDEKIPNSQKWQVAFYGDLLAECQNFKPPYGYIYKTKSRKISINLLREDSYYQKALSEIQGYRNGSLSSPAAISQCKMCEWNGECRKQIQSSNDVSQIYYVGRSMRNGLNALGVKSVDDLAHCDPEILAQQAGDLKTKGFFWKTMSLDLVKKSVQRAKIFKAGKPTIYEPIEFPDSEVEIHYDIEDDPTQDFVYLHGVTLVKKGEDPKYFGFFAESREQEKSVTKDLISLFQKYPTAPVYHFSPYEKTTLKRLLTKYPDLDSTILDDVFGESGRAIDLMKMINQKTDWPLTNYGLKDICKFLGFKWSAEDAGGAASVVWFNEFLEGDYIKKEKILKYNEDDCKASYFIKNYLLNYNNDL